MSGRGLTDGVSCRRGVQGASLMPTVRSNVPLEAPHSCSYQHLRHIIPYAPQSVRKVIEVVVASGVLGRDAVCGVEY